MKILAIGDFHGKFPSKLKKKIKKEEFDLIVSVGDYCGNKQLGDLFFKHVYGSDQELWEFIGKKKNNQLEKKNYESGVKILNELRKLDKPIIGITGNWDPVPYPHIGGSGSRDKNWGRFKRNMKKNNIKLIDFGNTKFSGINFVGYPKSTHPGMVDKRIIKELKEKYGGKAEKKIKKIKGQNKKYYDKFKKILDRDSVFVSHNCPYYILDKIAQGEMKGKHYGSWLTKELIKKFNPFLVICGHMHENWGKKKVGRTWVVNPGAVVDGKAVLIDVDEERKRIKSVRFLK
ncbi:MAG: metallophosphoesterase family protein [Nanoarchaeota archaeon]|nr:metallophosphoesterase family protein [Nanoarchaeota archaeon]